MLLTLMFPPRLNPKRGAPMCLNVAVAVQEFYFNLSHSLPSGMLEFVLLFVLSLLDVTFIFWIFKVRGCIAAACDCACISLAASALLLILRS